MTVLELLSKERESLVEEAVRALSRPELKHYASSTDGEKRERIGPLHELTAECIRERTLVPMVTHAQAVARARHGAGYGLQEVHAAYNAFEEVVWRRVVEVLDSSDYPEAFGLVSTVLGAGKEALAVEYVSLASRTRVESLDLTELFRGSA